MQFTEDIAPKRIKNIFGIKPLKTTNDGRVTKLQFLYLQNKEFRLSYPIKLAWHKKHFTETSKLADYEHLIIEDIALMEYVAEYYKCNADETIFFNSVFVEKMKLNK